MLNAKISRSFSPSHLIGKTFDENNLEEGLSVHKKLAPKKDWKWNIAGGDD